MAEDIPEDRGLKELFAAFPRDTVAICVPELLAEPPRRIVALQQEVALGELTDPSRLLDTALLLEWEDGRRAIIVLIEHWSEARRVDLDRVGAYVFALRVRHRAEVVPVVLVTDPAAREVPTEVLSAPVEDVCLRLRVRVLRLGPAWIPRLRQLQSVVAAVLLARAAMADAVAAVLLSARCLSEAGATPDVARLYLPLAARLARLRREQLAELRRRLREEGRMPSVLDALWEELRTEARQEALKEGRMEGRLEGRLAELQRLVARGRLSVEAARAELDELVEAGEVTAEQAAPLRAAWS